ncbi:MAG: hypothetical protein FWE50_02290 [Alphaproteobacteria bacterium]|nr:hypothetical protein [Alphaproteobacteria bacterium]
MKDFKMDKDYFAHKMHKLAQRRNINFRAFLINYIAVFLVWLFTLTPVFESLMAHFTNFTPREADMYMMVLLGIWKIAGVILFLIPAFATWWEMHAMKEKYAK